MNGPTPPAVPFVAPAWLRAPRRFLRSPKGYLLVALLALTLPAAPAAGTDAVVMVGGAVGAAVAMELALVRLGGGARRFPSSALLTGLIVGMVVGPHEPWYVPVAAGVLATDAKHLLRLGRSHVFNPAAAGLLAVYLLFASGEGWWGALADLPAPAVVVLLAAGYLVAGRANKLPAALSFLAVYTGLFTVATFGARPDAMGEVFRPPFLNAALFCAFFMVTDPPTSPVPFRHQVWFGALVGAVSWLTYLSTGKEDYLLIGIVAGNLMYALWRLAFQASIGHGKSTPPSGDQRRRAGLPPPARQPAPPDSSPADEVWSPWQRPVPHPADQ